MARGQKVPEKLQAKFRALYLVLGNSSEVSRQLGLAISTGNDLAKKLRDDPEFAIARQKLRAQYLDDLVAMRQRVAETALERFTGPLSASDFTERAKNVTVFDKRADYGRLVLDAERNAQHLAKLETETANDAAPFEVTIRLKDDAGT